MLIKAIPIMWKCPICYDEFFDEDKAMYCCQNLMDDESIKLFIDKDSIVIPD